MALASPGHPGRAARGRGGFRHGERDQPTGRAGHDRAHDGEDVLTALARGPAQPRMPGWSLMTSWPAGAIPQAGSRGPRAQTLHPARRSRTDDQRPAAAGNASSQRDPAALSGTDRPDMRAAGVSRESLTSLQIEPSGCLRASISTRGVPAIGPVSSVRRCD